MRKYFIKGNTTPDVNRALGSLSCHWSPENKAWCTQVLDGTGHKHKSIKDICRLNKLQMIPQDLPDECKTIQNILNKKG